MRWEHRGLSPGPSTALIACVYRAAEWRHKAVEAAAYLLLQHLDMVSVQVR